MCLLIKKSSTGYNFNNFNCCTVPSHRHSCLLEAHHLLQLQAPVRPPAVMTTIPILNLWRQAISQSHLRVKLQSKPISHFNDDDINSNGGKVLDLANFHMAVTYFQFPMQVCFSATVCHSNCCFPPVTWYFDLCP